ncbi:MAG: TetR/AcrR family transcriptional regulator [Steroidobacter sp.]
MSPAPRRKRAKRAPPARQDGLATRQQLLEAAGAVFAEHGYVKATSKEICARAQANIAAVNYHFGGKDGLYAAVLEEAHARLVSVEAVAAAAQSSIDPRIKLRMLLTRIVGEVAKRDQAAWELRVLSREVLSQSPLMSGLINNQIAPKARFMRAILAQIMDLPAEHPTVSRTLLSVMGPFLLLLIANRTLLQKVAPSLEPDADGLTEHMATFALAGMQAVARKAKAAP